MPSISVILPVRNGMPHLKQATESILGQTFRDFELLIVDNGSTDETPIYCSSLKDERVRIIRLNSAGLVNALNVGINESKSPVIARMDADDISHLSRLETQLNLLRRDRLVLLSCQFDKIDASGRVIGHVSNLLTDQAIRWRLLFTPAFIHPGAMFDKDAALKVGAYRPEFRTAQDYDLWTRLARVGRMGNHPDVLLKYRVLETSVSKRSAEQQIQNAAIIASRYASAIHSDVSENQWHQLHRLSSVGEPPRASIVDLARAFAAIRRHFTRVYGGGCQELNESIAAFEQHLRWRCHDSAKGSGLGKSLRWYRAARLFDPASTRLHSIARRTLTKLIDGTSTRRQSDFGPDTTRFDGLSR